MVKDRLNICHQNFFILWKTLKIPMRLQKKIIDRIWNPVSFFSGSIAQVSAYLTKLTVKYTNLRHGGNVAKKFILLYQILNINTYKQAAIFVIDPQGTIREKKLYLERP